MSIEIKKKSFFFKVSARTLILTQICVCADAKKTKKSEKYRWFRERHLLILMQRLQDISLARVLCDGDVEGSNDINEALEGAETRIHVKCTFKKNKTKQFLLTKANILDIHRLKPAERPSYSGGQHIEFYLYPQKMVVLVSLEPIRIHATENVLSKTHGDAKATVQMVKNKRENSKYFNKDKESKLTSSAVKKQTNLKSIVNKMKQLEDGKMSSVNTNKNQQPKTRSANSLAIDHSTEEDKESSEIESSKQEVSNCESYSRKRLWQEVDCSEDTGSENQLSETNGHDNDFVPKKLTSKKRKKCVQNEEKKDFKVKEQYSEQYQSDECSDLVRSEITHSASKPSGIDLSKATILQGHQQTDEDSVDKEDVSQLPRQEAPAVVVVEEADNKRQSPEIITINDAVPCFKNVKELADLTTNHIEFIIQKLTKKLKNIFKGKEYCRRHEDYKKGGRSKGDLAFQVHFGLYSDEQHDTIMTELMSIFCARHNKYIDYLSKVLLPETFVLIYMEVFGGNHDDVERLLMRNKKQIESQTDGSSTE